MSELEFVEKLETAIGFLKSKNIFYPERHEDFMSEAEELIDYYYKHVSVNGVFLLEKPEATGMDIGRAIKDMLKRGDLKNYPKNPICSHFGVGQDVGECYIEMSPRGNKVLFTIYIESNQIQEVNRGTRQWKGYPKRVHELRKRCIRKVTGLKIIDCWNDNEKSNGMSVVLSRPCPKSVAVAVQGYRDMPNVFKIAKEEKERWDEFEKWWSEGTVFNT